MATSAQLLNTIQAETQKQLQANEAAFVVAQKGANAAAAISESSAATLRATAEAQATIVREDLIAKQKVEQAQRTAALAAGYDPAIGAGPLLDRIATVNQKGTEVVDLTKKLRAERSVKIWENPMAWLQANFLSDTEEQVALAATELQAESNTLQTLNQAVQQTARTAEATAQTVTAVKIDAAQKVAATDATLRANQYEMEAVKQRVAAVTAVADLQASQLSALHTLRGAEMAEKNYQLNLAQESRARAQFNFQKEVLRIEQEEKKQAGEVDAYFLETLNQGNAILGRQPFSGPEAKAMIQVFKSGRSEELNSLYQIGQSNRRSGGKNPIVGPDAASAYDNFIKLNGLATEAQKATLEIIRDAAAALPKDPKTGKPDPAAFNKAVKQQIDGSFASIRPGSGNPFDVGDLTPYAPLMPEVLSTKFGQAVLTPAIAAKVSLADPANTVDMSIAAVKSGQLSLNDAVTGIIQTYSKANQINQKQRGFISFGIVPPAGGMAYNARMGFGTTVNLTDPVAVGRYISIELAKSTTGLFNPGARLQAADKDYTADFKGLK